MKKKEKKGIYLIFLMFLVVTLISSCSENKNQPDYSKQMFTTQRDANLALCKYIKLVGTEYILDITMEEAEELGVSSAMFINTQEEIWKTNETIKEWQQIPNYEFELTDPQEAYKKWEREQERKKARGDDVEEPTRDDPEGTLTSYNSTFVKSGLV